MIGQSSVVVVDAEIRGANFANAEFLLLVRRSRHRAAVLVFRLSFLLLQIFHLLQHLHALFDLALGPELFSLCQSDTDLFSKFIDYRRFCRSLGREFFLRLRQTLLCLLSPSIAIRDEIGEMLHRIQVVVVILSSFQCLLVVGAKSQCMMFRTTAQVHPGSTQDVVGTAC